MTRNRALLGHIYMGLFAAYLIIPLLVMAGAAFNDSKLPTIVPWRGFTLHWFSDLFADEKMWAAALNTIFVAVAVVVLSVPIGTAAAILINSVSGRIRATLYGFMIAPVLAPGLVIGVSTVLFWNSFGNTTGLGEVEFPFTDVRVFKPGLHLSALGQVSFVSAYVMLLVLARLQSFDEGLEEAALDLGASHGQVLRRILLPHLYPAIGAGAAIAFFQSVENFNITLFTRGPYTTLTVYVFSQVRSGITPTINALALMLMLFTLVCALIYETRRRRRAAIERAMLSQAAAAERAET